MATNKHATIRYQALDRCFSNFSRRYYIDDLIEACNEAIYDFTGIEEGVKRRQVFLDLTFMESSQGWSIPLDRIKDGRKVYYRYEDKNFSINKKPITQSESQQLKETLTMLGRFKGIAQFEWLEEFLSGIEDKFNLNGSNKSHIGFEQNIDLVGASYLTQIFEHIINKEVVAIEYQGFGKPIIQMIIHPYYLKQFNTRWFLFGLNDKYGNISNLPLDRIKSINKVDLRYSENITIDFEEYFDDVIGVTIPTSGVKEKILLQFGKNRFPYVESKPLHQTQKIKSREECIVEIEVIPNKELEALILSFGSQVEVLSPDSLRGCIKQNIEKLNNKYQCK